MYMYQVIMLYSLNLYNVVFKLYLNKVEKEEKNKLEEKEIEKHKITHVQPSEENIV